MNPAVALRGMMEGRFGKRPDIERGQVAERPTILIATLDPEIRNGLSEVIPQFPVNTVWVKSVEDARSVLATTQIAAVFCEIWLHGGTCRELIWFVRRRAVDLPIIIVSPPNCPVGYRDSLKAMNMKALYFLAHPYRAHELERFIELAIDNDSGSGSHYLSIRTPVLRQRHAL